MTSHQPFKPVVIGVLGGLLALVAGACGVPAATVQSVPDARPSAGGTEHWLGALNAPTVVEEYSDLQ
jgi:hypothetical protein